MPALNGGTTAVWSDSQPDPAWTRRIESLLRGAPRIALCSLLPAALFLVLGEGCATSELSEPQPLKETEIIQLSASGASPGEIIQRMRDSRTVYLLDARDIIDLHERGVSVEVLEAMLETWKHDVVRRARHEAYHYHGDPWCYPWGPGASFGFGFGW